MNSIIYANLVAERIKELAKIKDYLSKILTFLYKCSFIIDIKN